VSLDSTCKTNSSVMVLTVSVLTQICMTPHTSGSVLQALVVLDPLPSSCSISSVSRERQ
jgi:hypothetical protein